MSKYALKVGQSAVERLAVLDEIHAVTSSHILSGVSLPAPSRILDVGCGVGHTTIRLARHFGSQAHVVGIDREPSQIDTSKRENPSPNIEYRVGDLKDYLEQLSGYDLIYGRFVFGHNRDCIDLLGRIFANMRSGARLIFEEPDIGTARTLVGTGIIEEVEDLYRKLGDSLGQNFSSSLNLASEAVALDSAAEIRFVQPVISRPRYKQLYLLGLKEVRGKYISQGIADELALDDIERRLEREVNDPSSLIATARLIQISLRKS
ncbi:MULTISPECIES: bifunctional 2-polyprenyl-6-hydroxyphenol methylase/3-demethylubiquinol 3-O-methyltransferase UbiG [Sphingopyxis]|jgi:SAM-dependent methyltransferase|uniref:Methyltransferase domain-containing protein n=1 Tax=Sphingopyxis fribergensis TaxID=1515612 RepID=A0A0A7PPA0_9SPHN|nr:MULTISPECIES: class I SAM-dependent methyltransferase [Sphingopyxis]AJA09712.1 hypothetical protein SKP52_14135 [Sphingopyxis fribergensis]MBR2172745.1 class I SAM-dependent methyltransferase [Sphingopyxis sp.]MDR7062497.1 SAM-dependent methyltransferase [Sphingopyxis sp. BE235]MDR7182932.1 SAM-dependent methyltransferase [Sphingopyxis sp. BE249]